MEEPSLWRAMQLSADKEADFLRTALEEAEAIVVGIGAGMSAADGFTYIGPRFEKAFPDFIKKYHLLDMLQAFLYDYPTWEEYWAFASRFAIMNGIEQEAGKSYQHLNQFLQGKNYYVITTNADNSFPKAGFSEDKVHYYQGKYVLMQCSKHCHPKTYRKDDLLYQMRDQQKDMKIPSELVPRCPMCSEPLEVNKRTAENGMVEDADWHRHQADYEAFIQANKGKKILYLEIGVGNTTPQFIREPFQEWTAENPKALYVMMNQKPYHIPKDIRSQSRRLKENLADVIQAL